MKVLLVVGSALMSGIVCADTIVVSDGATVVKEAAIREAIRQDSTWTSENILANPYLFLQDQIRACDNLKRKIEAQNITIIRTEKRAQRGTSDAEAMKKRYEKFLADAKVAYKTANGEWPIVINGYSFEEDDFNDKLADAMERVELAAQELADNDAILKKVANRKGILKAKKRELLALRMRLVQQADKVKMNAALAEISELQESIGVLNDMMLEIDEDPAKFSLDDAAEDSNAARNKRIQSFLND